MKHWLLLIICLLASFVSRSGNVVVLDAASGETLPGASVFAGNGAVLGISSDKGLLPYISPSDYPLTVRCLGYREQTGISRHDSVIRMQPGSYELPEFIVDSKNKKVLHLLAFVRDYSTLSSYTDTVTLYREKWVDFMDPTAGVRNFKGWRIPRILTTKSYYRFTNAGGLDSVSDRTSHHFSWSDWVGIIREADISAKLRTTDASADTIFGKYSPAEIWARNNDKIRLRINVLADSVSRKWVPYLSPFFDKGIDFERFSISYNYQNVFSGKISPRDLTGISYNIESRGRGHNMFMFNRRDEPYFVTTYSEIYIVDREYITVKEARKWENRDEFDISLIPPADIVPPVSPEIAQLIERVDNIDYNTRRVNLAIDKRIGHRTPPVTSGQRILNLLKSVIGL